MRKTALPAPWAMGSTYLTRKGVRSMIVMKYPIKPFSDTAASTSAIILTREDARTLPEKW